MTLLQKIIDTFDGHIIDEYGTVHYKIQGKKYNIQRNERNEWTCDCPAFKWQKNARKHGCKHIKLSKAKRFEWLTKS